MKGRSCFERRAVGRTAAGGGKFCKRLWQPPWICAAAGAHKRLTWSRAWRARGQPLQGLCACSDLYRARKWREKKG
jgi:hypothetical protein